MFRAKMYCGNGKYEPIVVYEIMRSPTAPNKKVAVIYYDGCWVEVDLDAIHPIQF